MAYKDFTQLSQHPAEEPSMPTVTNHLVPYCPVLPNLGSALFPVSQRELAPMAMELLRDNPAIVVSGQYQQDWELNRQIGKTTAVKNRLVSALIKQERTVSYFNVQRAVLRLDHTGSFVSNFAPLASKARTLRDADVYVLDEVQHAIPFKDTLKERRMCREPYAEAMMALWDKAAKGLERGGRLVLISCFHPRDPFFWNSMYNSAMALFFSSPVLELKKP